MVVKHTNPCGIASRGDLQEAYRLAVRADPISAFGGIVAFNRCGASLGAVKEVSGRRIEHRCSRARSAGAWLAGPCLRDLSTYGACVASVHRCPCSACGSENPYTEHLFPRLTSA